jgi:hypothetical protein
MAIAAGLAALLVTVTPSAHAAMVVPYPALTASGNGIATGADGNLWVAESNGNVARVAPDGTRTAEVAVGAGPANVIAGPDGKVWVAVTGAKALVSIDPATLATVTVSTASQSDCGPVGLTSSANDLFFSLPNNGACVTASKLGRMPIGGALSSVTGRGTVFALAAAGGKLFAPSPGEDVVRRISADAAMTVESSVSAAGGPQGVAVGGDAQVYVTLFGAGAVVRFPTAQNGGAAAAVGPAAGTLANPFGVVGVPGGMAVGGSSSANVARVAFDGTSTTVPAPAGTKPWSGALLGPDPWFTDLAGTSLLRLVSGPPLARTGQATDVTATHAMLNGGVDPRGSTTQAIIDLGTSTKYDRLAGTSEVPAGVGEQPVAAVTGLQPSTTYHFRVRAASPEGTASGADATFTTPAGDVAGAVPSSPVPPPPLPAVPKALRFADLLSVPSTKSCLKRARLQVTVRKASRALVANVSIRVGKRPTRGFSGTALTRAIVVRSFPAGRVTVRFTVLAKDGRKATATRRYRRCARR